MTASALTLGLMLSLVSAAPADQVYTLKFAPPQGATSTMAVSAELKDLQVGGASMGLSGSVKAKMQATVVSCDEAAKTYKVRVVLSDVKAVFNGGPQTPPPFQPLVLTIDQHGRPVGYEGAAPFDVGDVMSTAAIPLQMLALATVATWLPDKDVAVGDAWGGKSKMPTPFGVTADASFHGKLDSVDGDTACLESDTEATVPTFDMANPMQPGAQMTVTKGEFDGSVSSQKISLKTGLTSQVGGVVGFDMVADMQGMQLPVALSVYFAGAQDGAAADKLIAAVKKSAHAAEAAKAGEAAGAAGEQAGPATPAPEIKQIGDDGFDAAVLAAKKPVLVDFFATWCDPCTKQAPIVQDLAGKYAGKALFFEVDTDKSPKLADRYKIEALPTLVVFKDGKEVWRAVGLQDEKVVAEALDQAIGQATGGK